MIKRIVLSAVAGAITFAALFLCIYAIAGFMLAEYDITQWPGQARSTLGTFGGFVSLLAGGAVASFTFDPSKR